jgi:heat-inducible transcriptional repressor
MSDLEDKGMLYHPHTSAGRVPTDVAYRVYVDSLIQLPAMTSKEQKRLTAEIFGAGSAVEGILLRAAQSLGVITQELGIALGPRLDNTILERLDLVRLSSDRILVALTLAGGSVRTIFIEAKGEVADVALAQVTSVLNERLSGSTLREIRMSLTERLRDAGPPAGAAELLNVFIEEGEQLFETAMQSETDDVVLGHASVLAEQPEFATVNNMRRLVALTETREDLAALLRKRSDVGGITISIGSEHNDPRLENFTVVTAQYRAAGLSGVIGVIGPTRMPYEKVISLVTHTSKLITELLE